MSEIETVVPETDVVVHPMTGEVLALDNPAVCASAIVEIRDLEYHLKTVKRRLSEALAEEAARQGSKTLHFPGMTARIRAGDRVEWDLDELAKLQDLGLPEERYDALVKTEVTYKVSAYEAQRIARANPEYAKVVERARHDHPQPPHVTVELTP